LEYRTNTDEILVKADRLLIPTDIYDKFFGKMHGPIKATNDEITWLREHELLREKTTR